MSFKRKYICLTGWQKDGRVVNGVKIDLKYVTNMKTNLTEKIIRGHCIENTIIFERRKEIGKYGRISYKSNMRVHGFVF